MGRGVNRVFLIGQTGQDPEIKYLPNGDAIANISLATSESWKDKNTGEQQTRTEWHRVKFFKRLAEIVGEYVKKGSKLYVEGRLQTRSWEQDGIKRYATEIIANEMQMLDSKGDQGGSQQQSNSQQGRQTVGRSPSQVGKKEMAAIAGKPVDDFDDDIPFN